jgi:hypothetical protein
VPPTACMPLSLVHEHLFAAIMPSSCIAISIAYFIK